MKKDLLKIALVSLAVAPVFAFAQVEAFQTLKSIVTVIGQIVAIAIPIMFALGILAFFYGLVKYIFGAGSEEQKVKGKDIMIWALVALFVMASVYGIIALAQRSLGITTATGTFQPPSVTGVSN